jgi:hypothetical protein
MLHKSAGAKECGVVNLRGCNFFGMGGGGGRAARRGGGGE